MTTLPDDRDPGEGDDERDRKRKLFSTKSTTSKEKSSTMLIGTETSEEALTTAQDFKSLLRPKKKNGFKLIKTKTKVSSEQKERRSSLKDEKRKSKANRDSIASTAGLVEQLRRIIGLSLDEAIKHNPLQNDDLAVPRFLVDCINIIDQAHAQDNIKQETRRLQQNRLSSFLEHSGSTTASASFSQSTPSHQPEVILIVNKREETSKTQQTPGTSDDIPKLSTNAISPKPIRQRERSGVETDDDELLAQIQKVIDSNAGIIEDELLKEKIIEARLIAQLKTIYKSFMNEKDIITKLEQQMNEKPLDLSNITSITSTTTSENELSSNQTVDILQELLNTIKLNNQLETKIEAIKRNIDNENERIEELCVELRFGRLSSKIHLNNNNHTNSTQSPANALVQVTKL
ncbi:unnamed protein product [Adineta steineri]|uniref:Uncharacterized protein n=1 Tax=Adineta steineri TaxID=433720 RepID=A0A815IYK5_9BILA|nr:unnamed protein product [Adineta steineri]